MGVLNIAVPVTWHSCEKQMRCKKNVREGLKYTKTSIATVEYVHAR